MAAYIAMSITESSPDIASNSSVVTVVLYYYGNGVSWNSDKPYGEITIAGSTVGFRHNFTTSTGAQYLGEYSKRVTHNSSGGGSVSCSASFNTGVSIGTLTTSRSFTLSTIPRVSDLALSKTSITADGVDTVVATATKKNNSFTDILTVSLGSYSKTITSGTAFTIPKDWINAISGTSATADVTVTTKSGNTVIGTNTAKLTVSVSDTIVPTVSSVSVSEAITSTKSAFGVFVTDISKLNVSVSASGVYGSTIQSVKTVFDNTTYDGTSFQTSSISKSGTLNMVTTVTDSRGRSASYTKEITVYPYSAPKIISASSVSDGENTVVTVTGAVSPVIVDSAAKNTKTLKISYKPSTETIFTNETTVEVSDWSFAVSKTFEIDSRTSTYDFKISLEDKISTAEPYYTTTGKPVISRYAGGDGVTLFEEATGKGFRVGNGQPATFTGDILIDDPELESLWNEVFGGGLTLNAIMKKMIRSIRSHIAWVNKTQVMTPSNTNDNLISFTGYGSEGSLLTIDENSITVGSGVSNISIVLAAQIGTPQVAESYSDINIYKNGTRIETIRTFVYSGTYGDLAFNAVYDAEEGDVFKFYYKSYKANAMRLDKFCLTAEVVKQTG